MKDRLNQFLVEFKALLYKRIEEGKLSADKSEVDNSQMVFPEENGIPSYSIFNKKLDESLTPEINAEIAALWKKVVGL